MILLSLLVAGVSGALAAVLVCKGVHLKLWADVLAGLGAAIAILIAGRLAGADGWPVFGFVVGYGAVVVAMRVHRVPR